MKAEQFLKEYPQAKEYFKIEKHPDNIKYIQEDLDYLQEECMMSKKNGYSVESMLKDINYSRYAKFSGLIEKVYEEADGYVGIGTGATILLYSDTRACTITEVEYTKAGKLKRVGVRKNEYTIEDHYDGEGTISDKLYGGTEYYTLRKGGGWYADGQPKARGSVVLAVGYQRTFIDPCF